MALSKHKGIPYLDNAAGTLTSISATTCKQTINAERAISQFFTFSSDWAQNTEGGKKGTITLEGLITPSIGEAHELFRTWLLSSSGSRSYQFDSPDSNTASLRTYCEVGLSSLSPIHDAEAGSADAQKFTANLMPDGQIYEVIIA